MVADSLTVLLDARGRPLTKSYASGGGRLTKRSYPNVAEFHAKELTFSGFDEFAAVLEMVARDGRAAVVRAERGRWYPADGAPAFRLLSPQPALVYARSGRRVPGHTIRRERLVADGVDYLGVVFLPTLQERPRHWVILDIDRPPAPRHLGADWVDEPERAVEHVLQHLDGPFRSASCWWSVSSSAALPGPNGREVSPQIKLKLAFLLDRPLTGRELKHWMWATGAPVDPATLNPAQLIYIAPPIFAGGWHDPVPRRSGVWHGLDEVVAVPAQLPRPANDGPSGLVEEFGSVEGLDDLVRALRERLRGEAHVREHISAGVRAFVRSTDPHVDRAALTAAMTALAGEFRSRDEVTGYNLAGLVDWYVTHAEPRVSTGPPPEPHFRGDEELDPAEASRRLCETIAARIAGAFSHTGDESPQIGIRAAAGLGKTREVVRALAQHTGKNIEIYVPTVALAQEIANDLQAAGLDVQVVRGREAEVNGERLCRKHEEAAILARAGLPVGPLLCRQKYEGGSEQFCEFFGHCPYVAQFRAQPLDPLKLILGRSTVRVMSHAYLFLPRVKQLVAPDPPPPQPDLVVIDESFWAGAVRQVSFGADRLTATRPAGLPVEVEADLQELSRRARVALEQGRDPREALTIEEIKQAQDAEAKLVFGLAPISPAMKHARQRQKLAELRSSGVARLWRFWSVLHEATEREGALQQIVFRRNVPGPKGELQDRIEVHWRASWRLPNVPVIALDASLDERIARKFLPRLEVERIAARRNAEIIQVTDTACSMARLESYEAAAPNEQARAARRLAEIRVTAEAQARGGRKVVLITFKKAAERLGTVPGVDLLHLGGLRGLDRLKHHDSVIVAGRLQPAPAEVEAMARSLFGDDAAALDLSGSYRKELRGYRAHDGQRCGVNVDVHPDDRVQSILEQIREREIEQAIDRLRLIHRQEPAKVTIVTNVPLDVTVDRFTSWQELIPGRWQQTAATLRGCIPLSPSELARLAPAIWGTVKAAELRLQRAREKGTQTPIESSYWEMSTLSDAATLVEYRRPGQRGSPHRAWLPGDLFCTEAARLILVDAGFGNLMVTDILKVRGAARAEHSCCQDGERQSAHQGQGAPLATARDDIPVPHLVHQS